MKVFSKTLFFLMLFCLVASQSISAQNIIPSRLKIKDRSFAIIVDKQTFEQCMPDIFSYQGAIEKEGLPTFIISDQWKNPEEVKVQIQKLYNRSKLEGIVLIGDIPIPMIRKAQQLATAFKMDEKLDIRESSIPSDRFYDDFDLTFDFLQRDSKSELLFYYELSASSSNHIKADIYSGRIKPIATPGKSKYQQVSQYLRKVVKARQENNPIDNVMTYLGEGTLSNSLTAWSPELYRLEEQFPNAFKRSGQAQTFRFDTWDFPKSEIINQIRRPDLDIALLHEHGLTEHMYISGDYPTRSSADHYEAIQHGLKKLAIRNIKSENDREKFIKNNIEKYGLLSGIIENYSSEEFKLKDSLRTIDQGINTNEIDAIQPNCRLTIFDACYNGDFREDDYIAGRFIFSEGQSILALANSVSILQDINAPHLIGSLGMGVRFGRWAQYNHVLESHVIGDPTFIFTRSSIDDIVGIPSELDNKKLLAAFGKIKTSEGKNLLLTQLYWNNYKGLGKLLHQVYDSAASPTTRYTCLHLANLLGGETQLTILKKSSSDIDEIIRRQSINVMASLGDPELIPFILQAYVDNQHASRILFSIKMALYSFDEKQIKDVAESIFSQSDFVDNTAQKEKFFKEQFQGFYSSLDNEIFNEKSKYRKLSIGALRNVNYHPSVDKYISFVQDSTKELELRISMLEALSWFGNSYRKGEIIVACNQLLNDAINPQKLKDAALRTLNMIK